MAYTSTIAVKPTETHERVAIVIAGHEVTYDPYRALELSAAALDEGIASARIDENSTIRFPGHPTIALPHDSMISIGRWIATVADQLLDEADIQF